MYLIHYYDQGQNNTLWSCFETRVDQQGLFVYKTYHARDVSSYLMYFDLIARLSKEDPNKSYQYGMLSLFL